ncbi:YciI family protein [Streptomyces sp. 142MFCol3.1]|uniref:YciI family protein n=1 Tax=Streptomyces sp. 142MFCol3.1 TaxID=1172179 RepID=UPI0003F571FC|nr:YciI family protein [Streptomyces sp. 142MFCol3.1]
MKYVLFACTPVDGAEQGPAETTRDPRFTAYSDAVRGHGVTRGGARLRPPADATTVRVRGDQVLIDDGPFTRSEQYVAGFDIVEAADLDEAIALASRHPAALDGGAVEVRPVWE